MLHFDNMVSKPLTILKINNLVKGENMGKNKNNMTEADTTVNTNPAVPNKNITLEEQKYFYDCCMRGKTEEANIYMKSAQMDFNTLKKGLLYACQNKSLDIVSSILDDERIDMRAVNEALEGSACIEGHGEVVDLIRKNVNVNIDKIYDICIFDNFSFITVPFQEAELILQAFKKGKSGGKALVELAKSKQPAKKHFYQRKKDY